MAMSDSMRWALSNIVAPVIVAVIIGMASAYATARLTLETLSGRVTAIESNIERIERVELADMKSTMKAAGVRERDNAERLIRLESKIDLILTRQAK